MRLFGKEKQGKGRRGVYGRESKTRRLLGLGWASLLGGVLRQSNLCSSLEIGSGAVWGGGVGERVPRCASWSLAETGDIYIWGWNESGQLALPTRSGTEKKTVREEGEVTL